LHEIELPVLFAAWLEGPDGSVVKDVLDAGPMRVLAQEGLEDFRLPKF
jgi:hypothetical protein